MNMKEELETVINFISAYAIILGVFLIIWFILFLLYGYSFCGFSLTGGFKICK